MNVGDIFGAWTVVDKGQWGSGAKYFVFEHECGNQRKVEPYRAGKAMQACKRCEARASYRREATDVILNKEYRAYKWSAKQRGYDFELTKEYFKAILFENCFYCGREPYNEKKVNAARQSVWHEGQTVKLNGVDRVDNTKGYTKNNCVPCCSDCNFAKRDKSLEEWHDQVRRWAKHLDSLVVKHYETA